ncbi:hypothetical protein LOTGIDRAFT_212832 [Lottia gigantea]|uniref:Acyl-coenzyme A oxidase n=1 Tax=Lottia gigantea TaxID=225164 RepID=V4B5J8_LOTGI|nr:hypothetical protein LOTGIDRAFT_212832 [Lottia gigantea]ESP01292.1 hypothetical protein LOTGIDRAFT_212832 [Lottia gigantea]
MASMKTGVHPDLQIERENGTFDPIQLTNLLHGGPEKTRRKRYIQSLAINDKTFKNSPNWATLSREERYELAVKKAIHQARRVKELGLTDPLDRYFYNQAFMPNENSPFGLHNSMFTDVITNQGTEEQKSKWLPLIQSYQILGTYAQTELGHGTFIRGLETTATFDGKTDEFIINTPTLTAMKYWPGALGKTCNYCLVLAQLYTQGHCHGLQSFIVNIRDVNTHQPMPGVEVGDIGTKFGYDSMDNGYLRMNNVRIPRENMLMKYSKVSRSGVFAKPANSKLLYGGMVSIRSFITGDCGRSISMACTIAIRYSAVRRQTTDSSGETERKILDYQTQQYKLFPALATSLAYIFAGMNISRIFMDVTSKIRQGALDELPQLHALSAGLKACSSYKFNEMAERCRMACGGHGFSQASGFPKLYVNITPAATYEGENTVLLLQTARYLTKCLVSAKQGEELPNLVAYLKQPVDGRTCSINSQFDSNSIVSAFEHRALRLIEDCAHRIQYLVKNGKSQSEAWHLTSVQLTKAAQAHCECCVVKFYLEQISRDPGPKLQQVLQALFQLYCIYTILENIGDFVKDGYLNSQQIELLNTKLLDLLAEIRPNAVNIVDSFDIPDEILASCLGRYDGQVYQALYEYAKESKLNQIEVTDVYYKHLKPFFEEQKKLADVPILPSRL